MSSYSDNWYDQFGKPVEGGEVFIYDQAGKLATLTTDADAPLRNPLTTNEYGGFDFKTADGLYSAHFWFGGKERYIDEQIVVGIQLLPDQVVEALGEAGGASLIGTTDGTVQSDIDALDAGVAASAKTADLASVDPAKGDALIGHKRASAFSIGTNVKKKLDKFIHADLDFGAVGVSGVPGNDYGVELDRAIAAGASEGVAVLLPQNNLGIGTSAVIRDNAQLIGMNGKNTRLVQLAGATTPMFSLDNGPCQSVLIDNFRIEGNGEAGSQIFYIEAKTDGSPANHGGLWDAVFSRLNISGTDMGMWFKGGAADFLKPNQFIHLQDVIIERNNRETARCLRATGQLGQFYVSGASRFDGQGGGAIYVPGPNVVFSRQYSGPGGVKGDAYDAHTIDFAANTVTLKPGWSADSDNSPGLSGIQCTFHGAKIGCLFDRTIAMNVHDFYMENTEVGFCYVNSADGSVKNGVFTNGGGGPSSGGNGALIWHATSTVEFDGLRVGGYCDRTVYAVSSRGGQTGSIRSGIDLDTVVSRTTVQLGVASNTLTVQNNYTVIANGDNTTPPVFHTIDSTHGPGAKVKVVAFGGALSITSAGNIAVQSTIYLRAGDSMTLEKLDLGYGWKVFSRDINPLTASAIPSSGYYWAGEFVRNTSALGAGTVTFGWQRLTSGTGHVAGTDWRTLQLTGV